MASSKAELEGNFSNRASTRKLIFSGSAATAVSATTTSSSAVIAVRVPPEVFDPNLVVESDAEMAWINEMIRVNGNRD